MNAPRHEIYRALLDPAAISAWRVPDDMRSEVHEFDPREGGSIRISLTYETSGEVGKSGLHTDTYRGRFTKLVPDEQVVEILEFETVDPALQGEMTMTTTLTDAGDGTEVVIEHVGLPEVVPVEQNELGTRMALDHLAALVERRR
jgi:uncharacterized protein YndB with AHSA1/START domain